MNNQYFAAYAASAGVRGTVYGGHLNSGHHKMTVGARPPIGGPNVARTKGLAMSADASDPWDCMPSDCTPDIDNVQSAFRPVFHAKMDRAWLNNEQMNANGVIDDINIYQD